MNLLNPIMLLGAFLGAIPIIIHLLNKSRYRVERFGAMMFLRSALRVRAQTLRLQQLLLLLLRVAFFAFLALALARPMHTPRQGAGGEQPTTHVVIVDGSYSMLQGQGAGNAFRRARESARRLVGRMAQSDNMLIIRAGRKPQLLFPKPSFDHAFLRNQIDMLEPGTGTMNLPLSLEQAFWALEKSTLPRHRIIILTDGQETGWGLGRDAAWQRLAKHRELLKVKPFVYVLTQSPGADVANLAPVRVFPQSPLVDTYRQTTFVAELANHAAAEQRTRVSFSVDGEVKAERDVRLPPGTKMVQFDHLFQTPGSHAVSVQVGPDDLPVDNTLYHSVHVMSQIPVLVAKPATRSDVESVVETALLASGELGGDGLFAVSAVSHTDLDLWSSDDLNRFKCLVLLDVPSLSEYAAFNVERFVEQGGGLLVGLGENVVAPAYERLFNRGRGVLPARLSETVSYSSRFFAPAFPAGRAGFLLDIFDLSRTRVLNEVKTTRYWRVAPHDDAVVPALFGDDPFLVYRPFGKGRAVLWTTSIDEQWSNFPFTQDYLPLLHNLVLSLSAGVAPPVNLMPGDTLVYSSERPVTGGDPAAPLSGAGPASPREFSLVAPDGSVHTALAEQEGQEWTFEWQQTDKPGLYTVRASGVPPRYFTVAPEHAEGDLTALAPARVTALDACPAVFVDNEADLTARVQQEEGGREWWRVAIMAALLLLCGELFLGWRFSG